MKLELVRGGPCPSCGAPIQFASNAAAAQVCSHCHFVVARTDRDLRAYGRVADLVPIASPLAVGSMGSIQGRPFRVAGRMQYDRAGAPGAPWQELYLELEGGARWAWLAHAQGNWYLMSLYEQQLVLPTVAQAAPGIQIRFGGGEVFTIAERGQRRPISAEGELPFPFQPGAVEAYADMSGPNGMFGTLDYSAGPNAPPQVYLGHQIDPRVIQIEGGGPVADAPKTELASVKCPGCGGDLPLTPNKTERVACKYCGLLSDVDQGALVALKQLPKPETEPQIPLGAKGTLRGQEVTVVGFMERGTTVDGERYRWREYLLYTGGMPGFVFLLEEDDRWEYIVPVPIGELGRQNRETRFYAGKTFRWKQSVTAEVDSVLGEFYWKVERGEGVQATEWEGPQRLKISEEEGQGEINCSFSTPTSMKELQRAFNLKPAADNSPLTVPKQGGMGHHLFWLGLIALFLIVSVGACGRAADKTVLEKEITFAIPSALKIKPIPKPVLPSLRSQALFGPITAKPPFPISQPVAAFEALKPGIANCFAGGTRGSFEVVATVGAGGKITSTDVKNENVDSQRARCARLLFLGVSVPGSKPASTITIPIVIGQTLDVGSVADAGAPSAADAGTTLLPDGGVAPPGTPAEPDTSVFTDPFEVPVEGRNLRVSILSPQLQDNWLGLDVALVHEPTGTVWEDTVEMSYYSGVEDGESWSEGSRSADLWYSRIPGGRYVMRFDPSFDPARPAPATVTVRVTSDTPPTGYVLGTFLALVSLYLFGTFIRRARAAAAEQQARLARARGAAR